MFNVYCKSENFFFFCCNEVIDFVKYINFLIFVYIFIKYEF